MTQQNIEQPLKATLVPKNGKDKSTNSTKVKKGSEHVNEKTSHTSKD